MAKNTQKNQIKSSRKARKKYTEKNFKYQTVCFKNEEIEEINAYCKKQGVPKNTFFREACMKAMGKSIN